MAPEGSLTGKKIVVTRAQQQATALTSRLKAHGATVYEIPSIEIVALPEGIMQLQHQLKCIRDYSWLILTSLNSVLLLDRLIRESGNSWRHLEFTKIASIGRATAKKLTDLGAHVDIIPSQFQAEFLAQELIDYGVSGKKLLLPRAAGSRPILPQRLQEAGAIVEEILIYRAGLPERSRQDLSRLLHSEQIDFLTFTSSSTVRNFAELAGELSWKTIPVACIGPITAQTLREYGVTPAIEAAEFTIDGLVNAMIAG